jgi:hypothetical protein
VIFAKRE